MDAIEAGAFALHALPELAGLLTLTDARWIVEGTVACEAGTPDADAFDLAAGVLADFIRKGRAFTRARFRTFMEAAVRVRQPAGSSDPIFELDKIRAAFPLPWDEPAQEAAP